MLAVRDTAAGERAAADITATTGRTPRVARLDLAHRASVACLVDARDGPLHLLVNDAGIMACPLQRTPEGWELQLATDHRATWDWTPDCTTRSPRPGERGSSR